MVDDFTTEEIQTGETRIFVRTGGAGPPILLLHGFPQTHVMWRGVAPLLARRFAVVCADLPTETVWERADARFALGFWPWSLLAQPEPLPEHILGAAADVIVNHALGAWGSQPAVFPPEIRAAYVDGLRDPAHAHAI